MKAILYTDGSSRPNPGFGGYSVFGYMYRDRKENKKGYTSHPVHKTYSFSSIGFIKNKDENSKPVDVDTIIEIVKSIGGVSSNNVSELSAFIKALEFALNNSLTDVRIITDSDYIYRNINENIETWAKGNWLKRDKTELANKDQWVIIHQLLNEIKDKSIHLDVEWTKSHADNLGNKIADELAAISSVGAGVGNSVNHFKTYTLKEYSDSFQRPLPFFHYSKIYYSSKENMGDGLYHLSICPESAEDGRRDVEVVYSVVQGKVEPIINKVMELHRQFTSEYNFMCSMNLLNLYDRDVYRYLTMFDANCVLFLSDKRGNRLSSIKGDIVAYEHSLKPGVIYRLENVYKLLEDMITETNDYVIGDITKYFYNENKLILTNNSKNIDTYVNEVYLMLKLGKDTPNYILLKNIEDMNPKIEIIHENMGTGRISRYALRVTTNGEDGFKAIYSNYYTSMFMNRPNV